MKVSERNDHTAGSSATPDSVVVANCNTAQMNQYITSTASQQALQIAPVFGIDMLYLLQSHLGSKRSHTDLWDRVQVSVSEPKV